MTSDRHSGTDRPGGGAARRRSVYGRRIGRPLRPYRQSLVDHLLPHLAVDLSAGSIADPAALFDFPARQIWLEIGFGSGEHLAWQAEANKDIGFIGCEPFLNGVARLLADIDERSLGNIRLWHDDARLLLSALPDASIDRIVILFPDPWPKTRHHKRRIIGPETVPEFSRVLVDDGTLRFASDISGYRSWTLHHLLGRGDFEWTARRPDDWQTRPDDWPETRYEAKARDAGRKSGYFTFRRVPRA